MLNKNKNNKSVKSIKNKTKNKNNNNEDDIKNEGANNENSPSGVDNKGANNENSTGSADNKRVNSENSTGSADNKEATSENSTRDANNKGQNSKNKIGDDKNNENDEDPKKTNKNKQKLHWGYFVCFGLIVLIVIAILIFAVIANFSSHNFAVETVNRIKESGHIQDSQQNYDTLMSIFQNQYSSFVSSLTVILTIFTIVISVLATIIPVISTKEKIKDIQEQQSKIKVEHEEQLNELIKLSDEHKKEYEEDRKKIIHSGLLTRRSMLAYEALKKNDIVSFEFHFNSARAAEPNDPLVDQYQADNYYEIIKYNDKAVDYINRAIELYKRAIEKHKKAIQKAEKDIEENNSVIKKVNKKGSAIKEHRLIEINYSEKEAFKEAYRNCANLYVKINETQDAIDKLEEVLNINMYDFEARNNLGSIYCNLGNLEKAEELFKENIKNMPSDYDNSYTKSLLVTTYWKKILMEKNKIQILSEIIAIFSEDENKNKGKENKTTLIIKDLFNQTMINYIDKSDSEMDENDKNALETMLKTISLKKTIAFTKEALSNIEYPIKLDFAEKYIKKQED